MSVTSEAVSDGWRSCAECGDTAKNICVFNGIRLGKSRGIERIIPKIESSGVLQSGCQTAEIKPQIGNRRRGGCPASQVNERNGGKSSGPAKSQFEYAG